MSHKTIPYISVICNLLLILAFLAIFSKSILTDSAKSGEYNKYYSGNAIDYVISQMTRQQCDELIENGSVSSAFLYYTLTTDITSASLKNKQSVLIFENCKDLDNTPFSSERIISSRKTGEKSAVVDYDFSVRYGVKVGDKITVDLFKTTITVTIDGIYENDLTDESGKIAIFYDGYKSEIDSCFTKGLKFNKAYIRTDNKSSFEKYLEEEFKPLGALIPFEETTMTQSRYALYLQDFNEKDYNEPSYVKRYDLSDYREITELEAVSASNDLTYGIILALLCFVCNMFLLSLYKKKIGVLVGSTGTAGKTAWVHLVAMMISLVLSVLISIAYINYALSSISAYISLSNAVISLKMMLGLFASSLVLSGITAYFVTAFVISQKKKQ